MLYQDNKEVNQVTFHRIFINFDFTVLKFANKRLYFKRIRLYCEYLKFKVFSN